MLVSELDADKNLTKGYVLGNEYVGQSIVTQLNGKLAEYSYFITDEQGSIRYVLGSDCNVQNYYQYDVFGESIVAEKTTPNRLRYNAQISDDLTGLYYLRARYYNPTTGRFTQEDVIYNDGLNLYAYCNSNPVMYCDPSGFSSIPGDYDFVGPITEDELKKYYESIRAYQGDAVISLIPYEYRATKTTVVDMEFRGEYAEYINSAGWERKSSKYFRELRNQHPEYFSPSNLKKIAKGQAPIVDEQYIKYFPQYADCKNDALRHHHIGGGGQATAIPESLHQGFGGVHNFEKKAGVTDNDYLTERAQALEDGSTNKKRSSCTKK